MPRCSLRGTWAGRIGTVTNYGEYRRQELAKPTRKRRPTLWWRHRQQRGDSKLTKSTRTTAPASPVPPAPATELANRARADHAAAAIDVPQVPPVKYRGIDRSELIEDFRLACISRALDDRAITLQRQSRAYFEIAGAGHEALGLAMARSLRPGYDWLFPYYRDQALVLGLGVTPRDILLQAVGSCEDTSSGGRQMPAHWGNKALNIVSQSSCTGSQCLPAVGCAEASRYIVGRHLQGCVAHGDELTFVSLGEGATSEGEFWESLEHSLPTAPPSRVPRRGQRMGHLGAGIRPGAGADLRARPGLSRLRRSAGSTAPTTSRAGRSLPRSRPGCGPGTAPASSMRRSPGHTRIHRKTPSRSTGLSTTSRRKRRATRSSASSAS